MPLLQQGKVQGYWQACCIEWTRRAVSSGVTKIVASNTGGMVAGTSSGLPQSRGGGGRGSK